MRNIGTCSLFRAICPLLFGHARAALIISTGSTSTRQDQDEYVVTGTASLSIEAKLGAGGHGTFGGTFESASITTGGLVAGLIGRLNDLAAAGIEIGDAQQVRDWQDEALKGLGFIADVGVEQVKGSLSVGGGAAAGAFDIAVEGKITVPDMCFDDMKGAEVPEDHDDLDNFMACMMKGADGLSAKVHVTNSTTELDVGLKKMHMVNPILGGGWTLYDGKFGLLLTYGETPVPAINLNISTKYCLGSEDHCDSMIAGTGDGAVRRLSAADSTVTGRAAFSATVTVTSSRSWVSSL